MTQSGRVKALRRPGCHSTLGLHLVYVLCGLSGGVSGGLLTGVVSPMRTVHVHLGLVGLALLVVGVWLARSLSSPWGGSQLRPITWLAWLSLAMFASLAIGSPKPMVLASGAATTLLILGSLGVLLSAIALASILLVGQIVPHPPANWRPLPQFMNHGAPGFRQSLSPPKMPSRASRLWKML